MKTETRRGSNACPNFFRIRMFEAACGGSYEEAGYHLALHARGLVTGDVPDRELRALDEILFSGTEARLWRWFERNLPRCTGLVPEHEREAFLSGITRAAEDLRL